MFTLWYTVLSYKEYRDSIWGKLSCKKPTQPKETAIVCPLPPKKNEPASRIPVVEPPKAPSPQPPPSLPSQPLVKPQLPPQKPPSPQPTPTPTIQPIVTPKPKIETPNPPQKLDPPPKPPRSPSPHPIRAEAFDDIEYEEEEEEESEESSEPEEEDSVLATPQRKPVAKSVNEFIDREKTS